MNTKTSKKAQEELPSDIHKLYLSPNLHEYLGFPNCSDRSHVDSPYSDVNNLFFAPSHMPYSNEPAGIVNVECACVYPMRYLLLHEGSGHFAIVHNDTEIYPGLELEEPTEQSGAVATWLRRNARGFKAAEEVAKRRGERTSVDLVDSMLKELMGPADHGAELEGAESSRTTSLSAVRRTDRSSKGKEPAKKDFPRKPEFENVSLEDPPEVVPEDDKDDGEIVEYMELDDGFEWVWVDGPDYGTYYRKAPWRWW